MSNRICLLLLLVVSAHADDWQTLKRTCHESVHPWQFHTFEECVLDVFTLQPFGPTLGNVGTGSGFGGGLRFAQQFDANHIVTIKASYSLNSSYIFSGSFRIVHAPLGIVQAKGKKGRPGQIDQTKARIDFNATRVDFHTQDFYGIGPDTSLAQHAVYRQQESWFGMSGYTPVAYLGGVFGVLGEVKYLQPVIKGVSGDTLPSVNVHYGEAGAPGSTMRSDFLETGTGVSLGVPTSKPRTWEKHEAELMYRHYFEQGSREFSFDRLEGWADMSLDVTKRLADDDDSRSRWQDALCMENPLRRCLLGTVSVTGRVTTSYASDVSAVPFYLQPTLGGADLEGVDTLRGLVDYRLRAPNRVLVQVNFDKPIYNVGIKGHPLGQYGLYVFFDAGNVSLKPGDLLANGLRKDVGVGFSVAVQNKIVARVYVGFGAGEGSHPNFKLANAF
jgi:hypothetical protein